MRDRDIRLELKRHLATAHAQEHGTLILDELGLCQGESRIDVAVVNGQLTGYEIKSERDTLERLPSQQAIYSQTLDRVSIVLNETHLRKVVSMVPEWWGILVAESNDGYVSLCILREGDMNPNRDPFSMAQMLWRAEALSVLNLIAPQKGISLKGVSSLPRRRLWAKLAELLTADELAEHVRSRLKARQGWRGEKIEFSTEAALLVGELPSLCDA